MAGKAYELNISVSFTVFSSLTRFSLQLLDGLTADAAHDILASSHTAKDYKHPSSPAIMANHATITTTFLIISDTHDFDFGDNPEASYPLRLPTPKTDVLLHCGDLTQVGGLPSFQKALNMLRSIHAELKLVIAGNHDLELDDEYWRDKCHDDDSDSSRDHDSAVELMTGPRATEARVTYLNEGTHEFTLMSGARFSIYVSAYTPAFGDWAFAYRPYQDRFNGTDQVADGVTCIATNPIPNGVDIVMTHGPAKWILDRCSNGNVGCENLLRAIRRVKPMMHCFGHIHEGYGVEIVDWKKMANRKSAPPRKNEAIHRFFEEDPVDNPYPNPFDWRDSRGEKTLAVNAAIMTDDEPEQAPWLVSLNLPRSS